MFDGFFTFPDGTPTSRENWESLRETFLPTEADYDYVQSLMKAVYEPGQMANWIAPPNRGINGTPLDFEYVRFA